MNVAGAEAPEGEAAEAPEGEAAEAPEGEAAEALEGAEAPEAAEEAGASEASARTRKGRVRRLHRTLVKWVEVVVHEGCHNEAQRLEGAQLSTDILVHFIDAGFAHKQLSNYLCLLPLIMTMQPIENPLVLAGGHLVNIPEEMDPLDKPVCLKLTNDGIGELQHRKGKLHNTNNGGGVVAQHSDTIATDTAQRDYLGQKQRLERHQLLFLEKLQQKCPIAPHCPRLLFKSVQVDWNGQKMSVEDVLEWHVEHCSMEHMTKAEQEADPLKAERVATAVEDAVGATNLPLGSVWSWLKRKRYPRALVPSHPRRLLPKLAEAALGQQQAEEEVEQHHHQPAEEEEEQRQQQQDAEQEQEGEGVQGSAAAPRRGGSAPVAVVRRSTRQATLAPTGRMGGEQVQRDAAPRRRKRVRYEEVDEESGDECDDLGALMNGARGAGRVANKRSRSALDRHGGEVDADYMQE
jgi:hypothetical protein